MSFNKEHPRVAIVGSGVGGLSTAIALKRQLNFENFLIFEKQSGVGGTWRDNVYPGCACDVAAHWYTLSTDLNPSWSSYFVQQPEIHAYWRALVSKYGLERHLIFNTTVVNAVWDDVAQLYRLTLRDERSGIEREEVAEALVSAAGALSIPRYPDIPGIADFKGPMFHTSRWNTSEKLAGKRVGVIGNAASAVQLIPRVSEDPSVQVINFCRTPNWFAFRKNFTYPSWAKWVFANVPGIMRLYRATLCARYDIGYLTFRNSHRRIQGLVRKTLTKEIKARAPKEYADMLIPSYPVGCKRILIEPGYLDSLHRPNVSLTWDTIERIESDGVVTKRGESIPLDVIVLATGFKVTEFGIKVRGQEKTLQEYFDEQGGPTAYVGTTIPGFPNFFTLLGPNVATGHASVIFSEEAQINYILQLLKPILARKASSFVVRSDISDAFNAGLQSRLQASVFTACVSWYRAGGTGKNIGIWPGPVLAFWWKVRKVRWGDYIAHGAEKWKKERRRARRMKILSMIVLTLLLAAGSQSRARKVILSAIAPLSLKAHEVVSRIGFL